MRSAAAGDSDISQRRSAGRKKEVVEKLGAEKCAAIGNGTRSIEEALDLLLIPGRLVATLRG